MGLLIVAGSRPETEETPSAPMVDQAATVHESWMDVLHSEVGGLSQLFGHDPMEHYPAPLETSVEPQLEPGDLAAMQAGASMAATESPQPAPEATPTAPAKWTFADTLKREVVKARDRLASVGGANGGA